MNKFKTSLIFASMLHLVISSELTCDTVRSVYNDAECCKAAGSTPIYPHCTSGARAKCLELRTTSTADTHVINVHINEADESCVVEGYILNEGAPFQVLIPLSYNANTTIRHWMTGQGGLASNKPTLEKQTMEGVPTVRSEMAMGLFSGIGNTNGDQSFVSGITNPTVSKLFLRKGIPLFAAAVGRFVTHIYDRPIDYKYFSGCSGGAQSGYFSLVHDPTLFDGLYLEDPFWMAFNSQYENPLLVGGAHFTKTLHEDFWEKIVNKCDAIDGIQDNRFTVDCDYPSPFEFVCSGADIPVGSEGATQPSCYSTNQAKALHRVFLNTLDQDHQMEPFQTLNDVDVTPLINNTMKWCTDCGHGLGPVGIFNKETGFIPVGMGANPQDVWYGHSWLNENTMAWFSHGIVENFQMLLDPPIMDTALFKASKAFDRDIPFWGPPHSEAFMKRSYDMNMEDPDLFRRKHHNSFELASLYGQLASLTKKPKIISIEAQMSKHRSRTIYDNVALRHHDGKFSEMFSYWKMFDTYGSSHCGAGSGFWPSEGPQHLIDWVEKQREPSVITQDNQMKSERRIACPVPFVERCNDGSGACTSESAKVLSNWNCVKSDSHKYSAYTPYMTNLTWTRT